MPKREERLTKLRAELNRAIEAMISLKVEKIVLFGSLAKGEVKSKSDIDLIVIWETDLPFMKRLETLYEAIKPNLAMDILAYTPQEIEELYGKNPFITKALNEGCVLYERER